MSVQALHRQASVGVETARRLRLSHPQLPIFHCTGHSRFMLEDALREGICDVVVEKPYTGPALVALVAAELERRAKQPPSSGSQT